MIYPPTDPTIPTPGFFVPALPPLLPPRVLAVFSACLGLCPAGSAVITIGCGFLCDAEGTGESNRLPVDTLCVLIADSNGDGFSPPLLDWAEDDDVLVTVSDAEYPAANGGSRRFDLADGFTEPGLLSRSLAVDLAQFEGRAAPVPVALRWFPAYRAGEVDIGSTRPAPGSVYGEFRRAVPLYPHTGSVGWFLPMAAGLNVTLDPLAATGLGGVDPDSAGRADRITAAPFGLTGERTPDGALTLRFGGGAGLKYQIQRGSDLLVWPDTWEVTASLRGEGTFTDSVSPAAGAYYRVRGPVPH